MVETLSRVIQSMLRAVFVQSGSIGFRFQEHLIAHLILALVIHFQHIHLAFLVALDVPLLHVGA